MPDFVVRVAVVQTGPDPAGTAATVEKVEGLAAEAASQGAKLVVFPEALLGGYPKGERFGVSVGVRTPEGREEFRTYFEGAVAIPGPETGRLAKLASKLGVHLVVGAIEREGGTLYCSAPIFTPDGAPPARRRKLVPTAMERVVWGSGDGSTIPAVAAPFGTIGAVICWENYMPLLRAAMYAKGVDLYCAPTVDDRETWIPTMRHVALEGRCFVLSACQFVDRPEFPIRGGSCVVDPLGRILAGPAYGREVVLTADLDRRELARGRFDLDVVGHYARPDVFRLTVDETPRRSVAFIRDPE